jgi:hypothetical protein
MICCCGENGIWAIDVKMGVKITNQSVFALYDGNREVKIEESGR